MSRCPVCAAVLPEGADYCPPSGIAERAEWDALTLEQRKTGQYGKQPETYNGCASIGFLNIFRGQSRSNQHYMARHAKSDYARFTAIYGKDCIMSEAGPLPMEREIRGLLIEEGKW